MYIVKRNMQSHCRIIDWSKIGFIPTGGTLPDGYVINSLIQCCIEAIQIHDIPNRNRSVRFLLILLMPDG